MGKLNPGLKAFLDKNMRDEVKWKTIEAEDEKTGKKYKVRLPNVNEYGLVGLTTTLTMKGIAGIFPSNVFTTTYLPSKFKEHSHFYATDVGQSIDSTGWTTTISGRMVWKFVADDVSLEKTYALPDGSYGNILKPIGDPLKLKTDYSNLGVLGVKLQQKDLLTPNIKINLNKTKQ